MPLAPLRMLNTTAPAELLQRRLLAAADALVNESLTPPAVDHPEAHAVLGGGVFLPDDADWLDATTELHKAFVSHPELDPSIAGG